MMSRLVRKSMIHYNIDYHKKMGDVPHRPSVKDIDLAKVDIYIWNVLTAKLLNKRFKNSV